MASTTNPLLKQAFWTPKYATKNKILTGTDSGTVWSNPNATGNVTLTLPKAAGSGITYGFVQVNANSMIIAPLTGDTIRGLAASTSFTLTNGDTVTLISVQSGYWDVFPNYFPDGITVAGGPIYSAQTSGSSILLNATGQYYGSIFTDASQTWALGYALTPTSTPSPVLTWSRPGTGVPVLEAYGPTAAGLVDLTPDTGTFTGTLTGCTAAVNVPCKWCRVGNLAILVLNYTNSNATGTSNSTTTTITGIPTAIQPTNAVAAKLAFMEDNGVGTDGAANLSSAGTITLFKGASQIAASWTASGTKGIPYPNTFAYILN